MMRYRSIALSILLIAITSLVQAQEQTDNMSKEEIKRALLQGYQLHEREYLQQTISETEWKQIYELTAQIQKKQLTEDFGSLAADR